MSEIISNASLRKLVDTWRAKAGGRRTHPLRASHVLCRHQGQSHFFRRPDSSHGDASSAVKNATVPANTRGQSHFSGEADSSHGDASSAVKMLQSPGSACSIGRLPPPANCCWRLCPAAKLD